MNTFKT